jgi:hypothetical protein
MTLSDRYREQATWARVQAEKTEAPELRQQWLDLAREYDRLAAGEQNE